MDAGGVLRLTADAPVAVLVSPGERYRDNAIISWTRIDGTGFPVDNPFTFMVTGQQGPARRWIADTSPNRRCASGTRPGPA